MIRLRSNGAGAAAKLAQQPGLGAAGIRPVAAEPVVMIARDQEALFRRGPVIMRATNLSPSRKPASE